MKTAICWTRWCAMTVNENIAAIFAKDPRTLTADEVRAIVAYYQRFQGHFGQIAKDGTVIEEAKKVRKRVKKAKPDPRQIDLEELIAQRKETP